MFEYHSKIEELSKWTILKVPHKKIYQICTFDFKSSAAIKTMKKTIQVEQTIKLIFEKDLSSYKDKCNFIHIGWTQITLKPLTSQRLNVSLRISLRDARCLDWIQSLMGVMPVYYNVYPNLSLSWYTQISLKLHH